MPSARVFVSHASEDKPTRIQPVVEALLHVGIPVWVDRPGFGENNLGLTAEHIRTQDVRGLDAGTPWREGIVEALQSCGAVLVCISRGFTPDRLVLGQELLLAHFANKLVTCLVDDVSVQELPAAGGLASVARLQALRLNTELLAAAVESLKNKSGVQPAHLPPAQYAEWQIFEQLAARIRDVFIDQGLNPVAPEDFNAAREFLRNVPHGPIVPLHKVPSTLVDLLVSRLDTPNKARAHFKLAMELAEASRDERDSVEQVTISPASVTQPQSGSLEDFWSEVVAVAGVTSRRTLAALFIAPHALAARNLPAREAEEVASFLRGLETGGL